MLGKARKIHFIGIGGIGMSGIAEVLLNLGFDVSGSDLEKTSITEHLDSMGARVVKGHDASNLQDAEVVVVSSAITSKNPELAAAREAGLPVIPRSDMLGEIMRMRSGIAIAGAHGKTTTTSLAAVVLEKAGLDPTVIVGGKVKSLKMNARLGEGEYIVAEVDESDGNFVRLSPVIALITNIDAEHLDFYGDLETIHDAFVRFARQVPFNGAVICCLDDPNVRSVMPRIDRRIITYGFSPEADVIGEIEEYGSEGTSFNVRTAGSKPQSIFLRLPGRHNVSNALGVCALAMELGVDLEHVKEGLAGFEGVGRRFELKGERSGVRVMDDYGHHPTEVKAAIDTAARSYDRRLVVVFQPHRYTRTRDLHQKFSGCFEGADELFITGIYAASENPIPGVTGELIYRAALRGGMKNVTYIPEWDDLRTAVFGTLREGDLLLTLGAGNIYSLGEEYLEKEKN